MSRLDEATRIALEALMQTPGYGYQSEFARRYVAQGVAQGEAQGEARGEANAARAMFMELLADRGLVLTDEQRQLIASTVNADLLHTWFRRALRATSLAEVFVS